MMKLRDLIPREMVECELKAVEKAPLIEELARVLDRGNVKVDHESIVRSILERERLGSTGIGHGVAIPHCKVDGLGQVVCCFGRSVKGVEFESTDGKPAHIFFLLVAPKDSAGDHLKVLALISRHCSDEAFREKIMSAKSNEEIYRLFADAK